MSAIGLGQQILILINRLTGNYKKRVMDGLIGTGDNLVPLVYAPLLKKLKDKKLTKKEKKVHHFCRQWKANRKKLK